MNLYVMRWAVFRESMDDLLLLNVIPLKRFFQVFTPCSTEEKNLKKLSQSRVAGNILRMIITSPCHVSQLQMTSDNELASRIRSTSNKSHLQQFSMFSTSTSS